MSCLDSFEVPELEALKEPLSVYVWLVSYDEAGIRADLDVIATFKQAVDAVHVFLINIILYCG